MTSPSWEKFSVSVKIRLIGRITGKKTLLSYVFVYDGTNELVLMREPGDATLQNFRLVAAPNFSS